MVRFLQIMFLSCTTLTALQFFVFDVNDHVKMRLDKDLYVAETAESLCLNERAVEQINTALWGLHHSCVALLLLPAPASAKAILVAKRSALIFSRNQDLLRMGTRAKIAAATARGYKSKVELATRRLSNACQITGPFEDHPDAHIVLNDDHSGARLDFHDPITWHYEHEKAGTPWF